MRRLPHRRFFTPRSCSVVFQLGIRPSHELNPRVDSEPLSTLKVIYQTALGGLEVALVGVVHNRLAGVEDTLHFVGEAIHCLVAKARGSFLLVTSL